MQSALPAEWRLRLMQKSNAASLTAYLIRTATISRWLCSQCMYICKAKHQYLCLLPSHKHTAAFTAASATNSSRQKSRFISTKARSLTPGKHFRKLFTGALLHLACGIIVRSLSTAQRSGRRQLHQTQCCQQKQGAAYNILKYMHSCSIIANSLTCT